MDPRICAVLPWGGKDGGFNQVAKAEISPGRRSETGAREADRL